MPPSSESTARSAISRAWAAITGSAATRPVRSVAAHPTSSQERVQYELARAAAAARVGVGEAAEARR